MLRHEPSEGVALAADLAEAVKSDRTGDFRDEALVELLSSTRGVDEPVERLKAAAIFLGLARRIESSGGDYPNLTLAAANLAEGQGGTERERALRASERILRPLAESYMRNE